MAEISSENIIFAAFFFGFLCCIMYVTCKAKSQSAVDTHEITPLPDSEKIDNLKIVEGIGPKIESLLHAAGITSMRNLANAETDVIKKILNDAGPSFRMHEPKTWSTQANYIAEGLWDELKEYQDILKGGKES